jgi:ATP-dependent helicase HrpA
MTSQPQPARRPRRSRQQDTPETARLRARLNQLTIRDEARLAKVLDSTKPGRADVERRLAAISADIDAAERRMAGRRQAVPLISYPPQLPVSQRRDDLLAAIGDHQVVVVAGETGSGKTTQLPKLCLELGRGIRGMIGHTQPRRIAARAVAERLAEELDTELGEAVGYAVRFTDRVSSDSLIKLMTDGIMLTEIRRDPLLLAYDTIIIDEAHERSLNIDFLLGYLRRILPRRPDLKVIVTSATIDPQRFADYFLHAPIVEVSGRSFPVQVWYRPITDPDRPESAERDQSTAIADAVLELAGQSTGDILVFLSGEREIRDTADLLTGLNLADTEVLPLYARLSAAEQHRIFAAHGGRRIVLATNIAETSLTVPGIRYVIDAGTARISRYSNRTKVQLLPIEAVSQASATQRAGRCGRTSAGICVRLYSEEDFQSRPAFTDPEIVRTNLASVILQMASLDLGSIESFGFLDPPDSRQVSDGIALLLELGALDGRRRLTPLGRRLAQLPIDPRLARMVIEAEARGVVADVLVLAAALSIQDPRERPAEHQQSADAAHSRFADPSSDFTGYLNLWRHVRQQQRVLSANQFRRMCRAEFLNYLRIREWQDLFTQLRQIVKSMGVIVGDQSGGRGESPSGELGGASAAPGELDGESAAPGELDGTAADEKSTDRTQLHRALLSGLLSHIGMKDPVRNEYDGARGARFAIFPGSAVFRRNPQFVMAAELVETSRLWGRVVAGIDPAWAEELADHLVKRSYSEPRWQRSRSSVVATERVTLYGVPIVVDRTVGYHQIDPELSRALFIRHALVEGDWDTRHQFFSANRAILADVQELENRARRRDIVVDDETIYAFYDDRIPPSVVSGRHFDAWWKQARRDTPDLLTLTERALIRGDAGGLSTQAFPDRWTSGEFSVDLSYAFQPGHVDDGVTVTVPLPMLHSATEAGLSWQVPGLRAELVTALLRGLPKPLRRLLVPVPETAAAVLAELPELPDRDSVDLTGAVASALRRVRGLDIPPDAWDSAALPAHLRPTYRIVDIHGKELGKGKDIDELRDRFRAALADTVAEVASDVARRGLSGWDFEDLPRTVSRTVNGQPVTGYPALVEDNGRVNIEVLDTQAAQAVAMRGGTRALITMGLSTQQLHRQLRSGLDVGRRLALSRAPHASPDHLFADCVAAVVDALVREAGGPVWSRSEFAELTERVRRELPARLATTYALALAVIDEVPSVELELAALTASSAAPARADLSTQLAGLIHPRFVLASGSQLRNLPRYLQAIRQRIADVRTNPGRDTQRSRQIAVVEADLTELVDYLRSVRQLERLEAEIDRLRWMIQELRVSLFAQRLGTAYPVSVARIQAAMDAVDPRTTR